MHQEDRRNHDAWTLTFRAASVFLVALASNAPSSVERFRVTARAILTARRSQKAIPSAKIAKTATSSTWPSSGEVISEYMMRSPLVAPGFGPQGDIQHGPLI